MSKLHLVTTESANRLQLRKRPFWIRLTLRLALEVGATAVSLIRFSLWLFPFGLSVVGAYYLGIRGLMLGAGFPLYTVLGIYFLRNIPTNLRTVARRLTAQEAASVLVRDKRAPILYLRSFRDRFAGQSPLVHIESDESLLYPVLREIGPVITIGHEHDPLPPLGAARHYVEGENEWQDVVKNYLSKARLVVISPDTTSSLLWELETIFEICPREKILISLLGFHSDYVPYPKTEDVFNEFRLYLHNVLKIKISVIAKTHLFVHFGRDGVPDVIGLENRQRKPEVVVRYVLHKLLAGKDVKVSEKMPWAWRISTIYEKAMIITSLVLFVVGMIVMFITVIIIILFGDIRK